jgi:hypothetical protein
MKMRSYTIQYASNLFVHKNQTWKQAMRLLTAGKAENLALLGNIGNPHSQKTKDFVRWCTDNWKQVYCVPGPLELQGEDRLNGLFKNLPKNLHILDQCEKEVGDHLTLVGAPLWTGHADEIQEISQWSEAERFFLAYKPARQVGHWHDEDVEFLADRIRYYRANYGRTQKMILLTHNVPHQHFLTGDSVDRERQILLHDGNIRDLLGENVVGCLSGSGGGSVTGNLGWYGAFCGVNAAFTGPGMVPNRHYRPDMTASFPVGTWPSAPERKPVGSMNARVSLINFFPRPQLAVEHANPVLQ